MKAKKLMILSVIPIGILGIIAFLIFMQLEFLHFPCAFNHVTGYYCPGCGGTRAVNALVHFRLLESLYYHPFVLYSVVVFLLLWGSRFLHTVCGLKKIPELEIRISYFYISLVIIFIHCFVMNLLHFLYPEIPFM